MNNGTIIKNIFMFLCAIVLVVQGSISAHATDSPRYFDPELRLSTPLLAGLPRLRFLTSLDFPPFNFADANKKPTGLNVDLARTICEVLNIEAKCEIQAMPWSDIEQALDGKRGEAIIAGTAISAAKRDLYGLSYTYFRFPARFIAKSDVQLPTDLTFYDQLNGKTVGVIAKSAHEAMLIDGFPNTKPTPFADVKQVYDALKSGEIELAFVDGVASSFWLSSSNAANCCTFVGDPYYSQKYLGLGMAVVTRKEDTELLQAINAALKSIEETGRYQEIYERYLPNSPH